MSRRSKRRRTQKNNEPKKFSLEDFRKDAISMISNKNMSKFFDDPKARAGRISIDYRDYGSYNFWSDYNAEKKRQMRLKYGYHYWESLQIEEKVSQVLTRTEKVKKDTNHPIQKALMTVNQEVLQSLYQQHTNKLYSFSKRTGVQEIFSIFYQLTSNMEKRRNEKSNLLNFSESDLGTISLFGIMIPNEIVRLVMSFIEDDIEKIVKIGGACKNFYLQILMNWDHVEITKENLTMLSLLVLKNCRSLSFGEIIQTDQKYLWKHISPQKLRKLELHGTDIYVRSVLNAIKTYQDRENEKLPYLSKVTEYRRIYEPGRNVKSASPHPGILCKIFPSLASVRGVSGIFDIVCLKDCTTLHTLEFDLRKTLVRETCDAVIEHIDPNIRNLEFSGISPAEISGFEESCWDDMITHFKSSKSLGITLSACDVSCSGVFDMSRLCSSDATSSLSKLTIDQLYFTEHLSHKNTKNCPTVILPLQDGKISEFRAVPLQTIPPTKVGALKTCAVDFNLCEFVEQRFFTRPSLNILEIDIGIGPKTLSLQKNNNKHGKKTGELKRVVRTFLDFTSFLGSGDVSRYVKFDGTFRVCCHTSVRHEMVWVRYERKGCRRVQLGWWNLQKEDIRDEGGQGGVRNVTGKGKIVELFCPINGSNVNEKVLESVISTRRPCLVLLRMILGRVIGKLVRGGYVDALEVHLGEDWQYEEMTRAIEQIVVDSGVKMEREEATKDILVFLKDGIL